MTVSTQIAATHTPVLAGIISSDLTGLSVTVNSQTYTQADGQIAVSGTNWTLQLPSLSDGVYPVSVQATDGQDNTVTATGQLTVDTTAPTVTIDSGQLPATIAADTTLTGTYSDANISTVAVTLTGADNTAHAFTATLNTTADTWSDPISIATLADGAYTVTTTATDLAGNATTIDGAGQLTISTLSVTVAQMIAYTGTPVLTGTVASTHSTVGSVTVIVNGQSFIATVTGTAWTRRSRTHWPTAYTTCKPPPQTRSGASPTTPPPTN